MKWLSIKEFQEFGYLQEVNRVVLHPLGLALSVSAHNNGEYSLCGIQDHRDDPEGMNFSKIDVEKTTRVLQELAKRAPHRVEVLGYLVQPVPLEDRASVLAATIGTFNEETKERKSRSEGDDSKTVGLVSPQE